MSVECFPITVLPHVSQIYRDFVALIDEANSFVAGAVDFAVLPGDNADDGTPEE